MPAALIFPKRQADSASSAAPPASTCGRLAPQRAAPEASSGPMIWPAAKADVMTAAARGAALPASRCAASMPDWVMTMNVPPTSSAATMTAAMLCHTATASMPSAITACAPRHTGLSSRACATRGATRQESAAARPNSGQAQPNTAGSGMISRAMAGRKVAGMM